MNEKQMDGRIVIESFDPDYPYIEYLLPVQDRFRAESHGGIDWFERISAMSVDQTRDCLVNRWSNIRFTSVRKIADALLQYTPAAIIHVHEQKIALELVISETEAEWKSCYYLPQPPDRQKVRDNLLSHGIESDIVLEFVCAFGGLRNSYECGQFLTFEERVSTAAEMFFVDEKNCRGWEESVEFYWTGDGDILLLNQDGRLGFWHHDSTEISHYSESFEQFCWKYHFISHIEKVPQTCMSETKMGFDRFDDLKYRS